MTNKDGRLGISGAQRVSGEGRQKRVWPITSNWSILWITNEHERSESLADHTHTYYWSPHRDIFPKGSIINKKTDRSTGEKWARKPDHNSEQTNKQYPIIDRQHEGMSCPVCLYVFHQWQSQSIHHCQLRALTWQHRLEYILADSDSGWLLLPRK